MIKYSKYEINHILKNIIYFIQIGNIKNIKKRGKLYNVCKSNRKTCVRVKS